MNLPRAHADAVKLSLSMHDDKPNVVEQPYLPTVEDFYRYQRVKPEMIVRLLDAATPEQKVEVVEQHTVTSNPAPVDEAPAKPATVMQLLKQLKRGFL